MWKNAPTREDAHCCSRYDLTPRSRQDISPIDAVLAGLAQGFAVLPGLSRSGLTVAALLARQIDRREALVLSFLMSIPASLGAGVYVSIDSGILTSRSAVFAAVIACVVGFVTIRGLLAVADRVREYARTDRVERFHESNTWQILGHRQACPHLHPLVRQGSVSVLAWVA